MVVMPIRSFLIRGPEWKYSIKWKNPDDGYNNQSEITLNRDTSNARFDAVLNKVDIQDNVKLLIKSNLKKEPHYFNMLNGLNTAAIKAGFPDLFKIKNKMGEPSLVFNNKNYKDSLSSSSGHHLLQIIPIEPDGNCFFSCIALALNLYNFHRVANKVKEYVFTTTNVINGTEVKLKGTEFTPALIRWVVSNEYRRNPGLMEAELLKIRGYIEGSDKIRAEYHEILDRKDISDHIKSYITAFYDELSPSGRSSTGCN